MTHLRTAIATALLAATALPATGQQRTPPAVYWMSVETNNMSIQGMPAEGGGGLMGAMMGRALGVPSGGPQRSLMLQLGSPRSPTGAPEAEHRIPPGQRMGDALPLQTPERAVAERSPGEPGRDREPGEKPRARMLIYWDCGENPGQGQPRVIDTQSMSPEQFGRALSGRTGTHQAPPGASNARTYGDWPNRRGEAQIPADSSLVGDHVVRGNYTPEIRFALDNRRDFMEPVVFSNVTGGVADAIQFGWNAIPTAIGYFATAMANRESTGEMVIWSSSEVADPGWGLMDYLTPADVQRFIREKAVMPPSTTRCTIPRGIFKDAEGGMLRMIAYGEELNVGHPPRPADPQWLVKVRLKSVGMTMLEGAEGRGRAGRSAQRDFTSTPRGGARGTVPTSPPAAQAPAPAGPANEILEGVKALRGLFGR